MKLDAIGFGLEHYNGVGLWQDTRQQQSRSIRSGSVPDTDAAGEFNGAVELANKLARARTPPDCYVGKWLELRVRPLPGKPTTRARRHSSRQAFQKSNGNVSELLLALTQTDAFLYRPVAQP